MRLYYVLSLAAALSLPSFAQDPRYSNKLAPFVGSPARVVDSMLGLANVKPGETVFDLGSGDGRILIAAVKNYKAKAVGIEISPKLAAEANDLIKRQGIASEARVIEGDLLKADLTGADVVTIYLATSLNAELRPRLEKYLKPGARVVSHDYAVPGWKPTKVQEIDNKHLIYLYEMPPTKN
jgi:cyclopropane fatty-acyl-phospholipid synthase-like methyltransferase